jgi:histidine triad (HIT) family protein
MAKPSGSHVWGGKTGLSVEGIITWSFGRTMLTLNSFGLAPSLHSSGPMDRHAHGSAAHCTFCDLIHGAAEVSVCHEDSDAIAFMDIQPVNNGHVLVVPRQHYESLLDVPEDIGLHLFRVTMRLANAVRHVTGCDDFNIVVNSGSAAGQDEPHYHVHIIPRRAGDGFDIPLPFNGSQMPDRTVLDAYAAQIISALSDPMHDSADDKHGNAADPAPVANDRIDSRSGSRVERAVAVSVFDESSKSGRNKTVHRDDSLRDDDWAHHEGAHGELLREHGDQSEA